MLRIGVGGDWDEVGDVMWASRGELVGEVGAEVGGEFAEPVESGRWSGLRTVHLRKLVKEEHDKSAPGTYFAHPPESEPLPA